MIKTKWLLYALLIRLIFMPLTGHWDLTSLNLVASGLKEGFGGVYNHSFAIYPPLTYYFLGLWQLIISPFVSSDFSQFLGSPIILSLLNEHAPRYFFLLKIPYLFFDFGVAFLLYRLIEDPVKRERAVKLWLFNPIVIYVLYMWGTIDIIPAFFVLLSLYLLKQKKPLWSVIFLGIGGSFKAFPFLFLPVLVFLYFEQKKMLLKAFILGVVPFLVTVIPFVTDKLFIKNFLSSDQLQIIQHAGFYIGREQNISLFYIFFLLMILFFRQKKIKVELHAPWIFALVIVVFYSFSAFTPQWFIWGLPLLIYLISQSKVSTFWYLTILLLYFSIVILFEITLNLGLFSLIEPTFLDFPSVGEKINSIFSANRLNGLIRSILAAVFLWVIYLAKPEKLYEKN